MKNYFYSSLKGLFIILMYFFFPTISLFLLNYIGIFPANFPVLGKVCYLLGLDLFLLFIFIFVIKNSFISSFKDFVKKFKVYFDAYNKYWFIMIFLMVASSSIVSIFAPGIPQNEEVIRETLNGSIFEFIYICISSVLIAPFMEELVFRFSIKKLIPFKWLFILCSGVVFGALHVVGSADSISDYLFILSYSMPGFVLAYTYYKSDNIFVPISIHMFHNSVMLLLQIFMMLGDVI